MNESEGFRRIRAQVEGDYRRVPTAERHASHWHRVYAPRWRNRVGLPRLIAEAVLFEALGLVRGINRSLFRNDPDERERFDRMFAELEQFTGTFARSNWARFDSPRGNRP